MRIVYFSAGCTVHDRRFLGAIAAVGHQVFFLRLQGGLLPADSEPLRAGVEAVAWRRTAEPATAFAELAALAPDLQSALARLAPDVVHAGPVQSCAFVAALAGAHPLLVQSWGSDLLVDADRDPLWRWASRFTLRRSDALFCDCDAVRAKARELAGYADSAIVQFPWGVDLERFAPGGARDARRQWGWEQNFVVLSTRNWEPIYGTATLLEAFARAHHREPRLRLALLGTGSLQPQIQAFLRERGLEDAVRCPGAVSHRLLLEHFAAADLYLSCATSDGTSVSLLEAMASGLPVVVTDAPGNREWVAPGENGWLARAGDAGSFAQALLEAASSGERLQAMGERNRRVAEQRADFHANFPKLLHTYERLRTARAASGRD